MNHQTIELILWNDYELIDTGDREKFERFGKYTLVRPEPKALWRKSLSQTEWNTADAIYQRISEKDGKWKFNKPVPAEWNISWKNLRFKLKPTGFKHLGIFPENSVHWEWIENIISNANRPTNILNLFAYTGGCTLAALAGGASVTHLDASKDVVTWARSNSQISGLDTKPVRWIVDDAVTFVKREIKRGKKYDGIIIDPPKYGRAENGKVWKFEHDLPKLLEMCTEILSDMPLFILINAYTVEYSSHTLANLLSQYFQSGTVNHGEIVIPQKSSDVMLPTSLFASWQGI